MTLKDYYAMLDRWLVVDRTYFVEDATNLHRQRRCGFGMGLADYIELQEA